MPFNRRPYPWKNANEEIREFYTLIGKIRSSSDIYADGDFEIIFFDDESLIFKRTKDEVAFITAINNSEKDLNLSLSKESLSLISGLSTNKITVPVMSVDVIKTNASTTIRIS